MRLLDLLTESTANNTVPHAGALDTINVGFAATVSNSNRSPNLVMAVQEALSNHTLVLDQEEGGTYRLGSKAWTSSVDGTWSPALDNAIRSWKRSINIQLRDTGARDRLAENEQVPSIGMRDRQYLLAPLSEDGLLTTTRRDRVAIYTGTGPRKPWEGVTIGFELEGGIQDVDQTTNSFLETMGYSAMLHLAHAIARARASEGAETNIVAARADEISRWMYRNISHTPDRWYTQSWIFGVLGNNTELEIELESGRRFRMVIPDNMYPTAQDLFNYFAPIAVELMDQEREAQQREREAAEEVQTDPEATVAEDSTVEGWARQLRAAFENSLGAGLVPGGRRFSNDIDAIRDVFNEIQTGEDYRRLEEAYERLFNSDLRDDIYDELDQDEYHYIYSLKLQTLRVLNPILNFAAIQWNGASEVTIALNEGEENEERYTILRERNNDGTFNIRGYNDYNIWEINDIIVAAVTQTGGELPDPFARIEPEQMNQAAEIFIVALASSYPELTTFYTYGPPFSDTESPDIGGVRRIAIQTLIGRMAAAGASDEDMVASAVQEFGNDREWLIGDGTEDNIGVANIWFDPRYQDDGVAGRNWTASPMDEDVEATEEEQAWLDAITGTNDEERRIALTEILDNADRDNIYERLYSLSIRAGAPLEEYLAEDAEDAVLNLVRGEAVTDAEDLELVRARLGLARTAPYSIARLFKQACEASTLGIFGGTDNNLLEQLIATIDSPEDYVAVNRRFEPIYDGTSLYEAVTEEDNIFSDRHRSNLARRIGRSFEASEEEGGTTERVSAVLARAEETGQLFSGPFPSDVNDIELYAAWQADLNNEISTDEAENLLQVLRSWLRDNRNNEALSEWVNFVRTTFIPEVQDFINEISR